MDFDNGFTCAILNFALTNDAQDFLLVQATTALTTYLILYLSKSLELFDHSCCFSDIPNGHCHSSERVINWANCYFSIKSMKNKNSNDPTPDTLKVTVYTIIVTCDSFLFYSSAHK